LTYIKKKELEILLEKVEPHPNPKPNLEQYTIPADVAAEILFIASYTYDDIICKRILDLGCGTGRLGIGAALLGACEVVGVDLDVEAVRIACKNAFNLGVSNKVIWVASDISCVKGFFDTVLQNPPFGVQKRTADRSFLRKALEVGSVVYSIHKSGDKNRHFIRWFVESLGGEISAVIPMKISIPMQFKFHVRRKYVIDVDLYRIEVGKH